MKSESPPRALQSVAPELVPHLDEREDQYPLSAMQYATLLHSIVAPEDGVYLQQKVLTLHESLDVPAFEQALLDVVGRHPVLRTAFLLDSPGRPTQVVRRVGRVTLDKVDWRTLAPDVQQDHLRSFLTADKRKPFDFEEGPPMRFSLFRTGDTKYEFVWSSHHALMDGRSYLILLIELFELYEGRVASHPVILPRRRPFADYIRWLEKQDSVRAESFWRERLAGITGPTSLGSDSQRQIGVGEMTFAERNMELAEDVTSTMVALAQRHHVTVNSFIQGGWALVCNRASGREDVLFGVTKSCRASLEGGQDVVGLCINTIPFRARVDPELTVIEFAKQLRAQQIAVRGFEHTALPLIHQWSEIPPQHSFFDSVIVFENSLVNTRLRAYGGAWAHREFRLEERTHYPLTLSAYLDCQMILKLGYDRRRFTDTSADKIFHYFQSVLATMVTRPESKVEEVLRLAEPNDPPPEWRSRENRPGYQWIESEHDRPNRVTEICEAIRPHESFWADRLSGLEVMDLSFLDQRPDAPGSHAEGKSYFEVRLPIPAALPVPQTDQHAYDSRHEWLLTVFLAFLTRVGGGGGDVDLRWRAQLEIDDELDGRFAAYVPFRTPAVGAECSIEQFYGAVTRQLQALAERKTYLRDVWVRYPELRARGFSEGGLPIAIELVEELDSHCQPRPGTVLHLQIPCHGEECRWMVAESRGDRAAAEALRARFITFLESAAHSLGHDVMSIPLLTDDDHRRLAEWNDTMEEYPRDRCAHQLFVEQARHRSDAPAVLFEGRTLTYGELDRSSSRLAAFLSHQGIGPGSLVGLYMNRSLHMMISLLGIMKAGAAYVPMDPAYPPERMAYMLADSGVRLLLTQSDLKGKVQNCGTAVVALDESWHAIAAAHDEEPVDRAAPEGLAYVIYTSGSTGRPKGVQVGHRALTNLLSSMARTPGFTPRDKLLAVTTICFDIAALELYLPLISGGVVELATTRAASDGFELRKCMELSRPTVMQATPATWKMLRTAGWTGDTNLKILCGGEALPRDLANELVPLAGEVWNLYGPTETTIWSSVSLVTAEGKVTIGRPIANTQFYVLDQRLQPVLPGVPGELYIAGEGVAAGYFHQPELTQERFLPCPFGKEGAVMYRTGDIVRFLRDGQVEYLHRADRQIKLHGYRIELGEIEHALRKHSSVREAIVLLREDAPGDGRLVAYVVSAQRRGDVDSAELRRHLQTSLPDYFVPTIFMTVERIPLTPNGKVDQKALPLPSPNVEFTGDRERSAPSGELERCIATIWCSVLGYECVELNDSFFEVGGNSLLLMEVVKRLRTELRKPVTTVEMLAHPTVRMMAQHLTGDCEGSVTQPSERIEYENGPIGELRRKRLNPPRLVQP